MSEPLNLYDKTEWWDVVRVLKPGLTVEEYEEMWEEFRELKAAHLAKMQRM